MHKVTCPNCNTRYGVRIRIKTQELVCTKCGYIGKLSTLEKQEATQK